MGSNEARMDKKFHLLGKNLDSLKQLICGEANADEGELKLSKFND